VQRGPIVEVGSSAIDACGSHRVVLNRPNPEAELATKGEYEDETESRSSHLGRFCRDTRHDGGGISPRHAVRREDGNRRRLGDHAGGATMGMLVHVLNGTIIFPLAYGVLFYRLLPGPTFVKGLTFALVLWLASQLLASHANDRGRVFQLSHGWDQGGGHFAARSSGLRSVAGLVGWEGGRGVVHGGTED
jgi:hypothetical protein